MVMVAVGTNVRSWANSFSFCFFFINGQFKPQHRRNWVDYGLPEHVKHIFVIIIIILRCCCARGRRCGCRHRRFGLLQLGF